MPRSGRLGIPRKTLAHLGDAPRDLSRFGSSRVLAGNDLILKIGPPDRAEREAFLLRDAGLSSCLVTPSLIDAGDGWLLLQAIDVGEPSDPARWRASALADLARLHDAFAGSWVLNDRRLRGVTARELTALAEECRELAGRLNLVEPLRTLSRDLTPLVSELDDQETLVHGDAWEGNVLSTALGARYWIDWEEAGSGHAALDLANWLYGSPWVPAAPDPAGDLAAYLSSRATPIDPTAFRRAVDAAVVLLFLLLDLSVLAEGPEHESRELIERRALTARQFLE